MRVTAADLLMGGWDFHYIRYGFSKKKVWFFKANSAYFDLLFHEAVSLYRKGVRASKELLDALHVMATTDNAVTWQKHSCIAQIEYEKVNDYKSAQDIIEERKRRGV